MPQECCTVAPRMIFACAGGSNVGQLSNRAAVELTHEGFGKIFCLAGVGAHLSGFVQSAKDIDELVVIDGCDIGCAKSILAHAEIPVKKYLLITELGIEKNKNMNLNPDEVARVKDAVKKSCGQ